MSNNQNKISYLFLDGSDLQNREKEVLKEASQKTGFIPTKLIDRSHWWTSKEIGAFRYEGKYKGKKAVIKIQGVKPNTSEIYMIQAFKKANKSKILRPPELYDFLPWNEERRYEALVLEFVEGKKIVNTPTNKTELNEFFDLYKDYKTNCVLNPWIDKPSSSLSEEISNNFAKWKEASIKLYKNHTLREKDDGALIDKAINILVKEYKNVNSEFQHGHFSIKDLRKISDAEVVVLSNLYWSWKPPFYDAVFGQHWFFYQLAELEDISEEQVEGQISLWLSKINELVENDKDKKLVNLALLERAAAGLNLDGLSVDYKKPIAKYLVDKTRIRIKELIEDLS